MIRVAHINEYKRVLDFYYQLIDDMEGMEYHPKWQKGVYPDPAELRIALENAELFIDEEENEVISAMRVNHDVTDGYDKVAWAVDADKEHVTVIHMLGVAASHQGKGIAKKMVQFVIDKAGSERQNAIRLDVLVGNIPANRLYESMGFEYRERITLYYEDTGFTDFDLYEMVL